MRLLILSSKTGGGHEMRAQALSEFCMSLNIQYKIVRPLEEVGGLYLLELISIIGFSDFTQDYTHCILIF